MQQELLRYFSDKFENQPFSLSEIDSRIFQYLKSNKLEAVKGLLSFQFNVKQPLQRIEQWRLLLKNVLMVSLKSIAESAQDQLKKSWFELYAHHHGKQFQLEQAYLLLTAQLLGIHHEPEAAIFQYEDGFTPLSTQIDHPFLNVPFLDWHAELGIIWGLIGHLKKDEAYVNAAIKISKWHKKNLDNDFKPFKGFLSSHHLSHYENILMVEGVLFHLASLLEKNSELAYLAKQHFGWFFQSSDYELKNISTSSFLCLRWMDILFKEQLTPIVPKLSEKITDSFLPIIGQRTSECSYLFSLLGTNVGLGSFKFHDLEIPAFGPQLQILGEERLFGFMGYNPLQKETKDSFKCDFSENYLSLEGTLGLPRAQLEVNPYELWKFSSDWLNCSFFVDQNNVTVNLRPLQVKSNCFFVFYVSAEKCLIEGEENILPHSLNQYEGILKTLNLQSESAEIILQSKNPQKVKVIPLEGHRSFWGANYLIAYHLNNKYSSFEWKITTNQL